MVSTVLTGVFLPFLGTALGSSAVFFMKSNRRAALTDCLSGFTGGIMLAASVWSLLIPAIEKSNHLGAVAFVPASVGFMLGVVFMLLSERLIERLTASAKGIKSRFVTAFAVTIHNIPEGMAVGMVYAALLSDMTSAAVAGAVSLSLGIAIQNIPEGAIVSLPLYNGETGKLKAFLSGVLSGGVEPVAAAVAILCVGFFSPLMPYFLSFAAGAMIFVVMHELSVEMKSESGRGILFFAFGFSLMMSLDVALG